jgi:hypothetical protein
LEEPEEPAEPEEVPEPANCMKLCNRAYDPTCGHSQKEGYKIYSNPCMMDVLSCEAGDPARKTNDAVCAKKSNGSTRFYKTGCQATTLGAEIVDISECQEEEEEEEREMMMDVAEPVATHQVQGNARPTRPKKGNKGKKKGNKQGGIWTRLPTWGSFHPFGRR